MRRASGRGGKPEVSPWPGPPWPVSAWWRATTAPTDAQILPNGDVTPPIRGVRLDGSNGNLEIVDSEAGLDGDPVYARAMGPMQFIPETWRLYGVDANNDGVISPDNIDDAALSAAGYLCFRARTQPPRAAG